MDTNFSIDMLLRWSKEVSLQTKTSSRQRRDISIEINVIRRCTPAECYVYRQRKNRLYKGTLPKYLHTRNILSIVVCVSIKVMKFHSKDPKRCFGDRYGARYRKSFQGVVKPRNFFVPVKL